MRRYEKYKDSGIEWIGEIPEHWEVDKLGWQGYFSASGIDKKDVPGEPMVNMINYTDIYGNTTKTLTTDREYMIVSCPEDKKQTHQVKIGDLIFTPSSETVEDIGLSALVAEDLPDTVFSYHVIRLEFKREFDLNFKKYLCNNHFVLNKFSREAKGTTRQIIGRDVFKKIEIVIPPLDEQIAIANYLDQKTAEIDELIKQKEKLLLLFEEEKKAIINNAVTKGINPEVKLKDSGIEWLGEIPENWEIKKLKYKVKLITEKNGSELQKVGLENIESLSGTYIETNSDFEGEGIHFEIGDILYGKLRPYLAKVFLADFEGAAVGDFFVLRPSGEVLPSFVKYRLLSTSFTEISNSSTYGSKMPRVSWEYMSNLFFAWPSMDEQILIVQFINSETSRIDSKLANTKKLISQLKEYKTALISEVATGKVKVI